MKMNKFLMLGIAGLAFAACSNEEDAIGINPTTPNDGGAVAIRLTNVNSNTKALSDAVATVTLKSAPITITLTDKKESGNVTQTIIVNSDAIDESDVLYFWNVTEPQSITVSMNDGKPDYSTTDISTFASITPDAIPAYGETKAPNIKLTTSTGSPAKTAQGGLDMSQDNDGTATNDISTQAGTGLQQGAKDGDQDRTYQMYEAKIQMAIPVSRMEISGLKHKAHAGQECDFDVLDIAGVYMDHMYANGGTYSENASNWTESAFGLSADDDYVNYCWDGTAATGVGTAVPDYFKDAVADANEDFLTTASYPVKSNKVYAYYFYPGAEDPIFKVYFDACQPDPNADEVHASGAHYAMIAEYTGVTAWEAGKIYRITEAELEDGHVLFDEENRDANGIKVTVMEAKWEIISTDVTWAE